MNSALRPGRRQCQDAPAAAERIGALPRSASRPWLAARLARKDVWKGLLPRPCVGCCEPGRLALRGQRHGRVDHRSSAELHSAVSQIFNLRGTQQPRGSGDFKRLPTAGRRYGRLQICATRLVDAPAATGVQIKNPAAPGSAPALRAGTARGPSCPAQRPAACEAFSAWSRSALISATSSRPMQRRM